MKKEHLDELDDRLLSALGDDDDEKLTEVLSEIGAVELRAKGRRKQIQLRSLDPVETLSDADDDRFRS